MKKILSAFLSVIMLMSLALTSFAANDDTALKAAMTVAKERIDIGDEYTEFDYSVNSTEIGKNSFNMTWYDKNYTKRINATVCGNVITNYSKDFEYSSEEARFGRMSKTQLFAKAKAFIKQINPTIYTKIVVDENSFSANIYSTTVTISLYRESNGIKVSGNTGTISLNKDTGEVVAYYFYYTQNAGFKSPKTAISEKEAMSQIEKLYEIEPVYSMEYDWETNERNVHLIYNTTVSGDIDAFTGKFSTFEESYGEYTAEDSAVTDSIENPMTGGEDKGVTFNENELNAIDKNKNFLSEEQIIKILKDDPYIGYTDDMTLNNVYLETNYDDKETFIYHLSFSTDITDDGFYKSISVIMNAETGKISQFYKYQNDLTNNFNEKKADTLAEKAAKYYVGKNFSEYKLTSANTSNDYYTNEPRYKSYTYTRYVNDIRTDFDTIYISVDSSNSISSFYYSYTDIDFPSADRLTKAQAFSKLFEQIKPELSYKINVNAKTHAVKTALIYEMPYFVLDAKTGEITYSWYYNSNDNTEYYNDINGDLKNYADKLAEYGIYLIDEKGNLNPNQAITEDDFYSLINNLGNNYYYPVYYAFEDVMVMDETTTTAVSTPKNITRAEVAKAFVSSIYGTKTAELKGIFKSPYKDISESDANVGYIAIAAAIGVMSGDANGNFNPNATFTRGEALMMIYNYLNK